MVEQVLHYLAPQPGETVLDATLGRGGHGEAIIPRLGPSGRYIGLDLDAGNIAYAQQRLRPLAEKAEVELILQQGNFQDSRAILNDLHADRSDALNIDRVDGLLADLGFASSQMDDPQRGFSFSHETDDAPLDMRLNPSQPTTAAELVNHLPQRELADLIYHYGEEPFSRRIARKIVETRRGQPIQTTRELSELVRQAYGPRARHSRMHPATRTFMALRIAVNGELDALDRLLEALPHLLARGGRAAVISFHSLEDRRVKQAFLRFAQDKSAERLTRKPITPDEAERASNPRSRSAKLRALRWGEA